MGWKWTVRDILWENRGLKGYFLKGSKGVKKGSKMGLWEMGGVGAKIGAKLTKKPKIWSFLRGFSSKNVSGHRYFLQYPPNGQQKPVGKFLPNNVLFRYPPPP